MLIQLAKKCPQMVLEWPQMSNIHFRLEFTYQDIYVKQFKVKMQTLRLCTYLTQFLKLYPYHQLLHVYFLPDESVQVGTCWKILIIYINRRINLDRNITKKSLRDAKGSLIVLLSSAHALRQPTVCWGQI